MSDVWRPRRRLPAGSASVSGSATAELAFAGDVLDIAVMGQIVTRWVISSIIGAYLPFRYVPLFAL